MTQYMKRMDFSPTLVLLMVYMTDTFSVNFNLRYLLVV
jgi:hypothetical protein